VAQERRAMLGSLLHSLSLMQAVGAQPGAVTLRRASTFLRSCAGLLTDEQRRQLRGVFQAWRYTEHGMRLRS
jgi:hypothetical protein